MNNETKYNVIPKLRFPEFQNAEEWEELTLIELATFRRGSFPQPYGLPEWYDDINGMPFIQVFDVADNFLLKPKTKSKISALAAKQSVFIPQGTVIITIQGSIGRVAITQYDAYIDRTLLLFETFLKPTNKFFFAYVLFMLFEIEKLKAPGGIIKTITKEVLSDFTISLPSPLEQQKIASCLSSLDDLITAENEKLTQLKNHKKGLMQNLFPSEGQTIPKLRFKEFENSGEWVEKKLGELCVLITKGTTPQKFTDSGIRFIKIEAFEENRILSEKCMFIDEYTHSKELKRSMLIEDDILFAIAGATIGKVNIVLKEILPANTNQALAIIRLKKSENKDYVYSVMKSEIMQSYIKKSISVGAQPNLNLEQIGNFILPYPTISKEQKKIASCLSSLDELITTQTKKIEQLKQHKKGLMQQLFPLINN